MENNSAKLILNTAVPACYIEREPSISGLNKVMITQWLNRTNPGIEHFPRHYSEYIRLEVLEAKDDRNLWTAIETSDHIWCSSAFERQESAQLFIRALDQSILKFITNKIFFDLAERREAMFHLARFEPNIHSIIKRLEEKHAIRFMFWEELWSTMQQPPTPDDPPP